MYINIPYTVKSFNYEIQFIVGNITVYIKQAQNAQIAFILHVRDTNALSGLFHKWDLGPEPTRLNLIFSLTFHKLVNGTDDVV